MLFGLQSARVGRNRLQQMKHVQPQHHHDVELKAWFRRLDVHVENGVTNASRKARDLP